MSAQTHDPAVQLAAIEAYVDLLNGKDAAPIVALYAAEATVEDPVGTDIRTGHPAIAEFYNNIAPLDTKAKLLWHRVVGDTAVFEFEMLTTVGDDTYRITPVDIMIFNTDGLITSMRAVWSQADLQLLD